MTNLFSQSTEEVLAELKRALTEEGFIRVPREPKAKVVRESKPMKVTDDPFGNLPGESSQALMNGTDIINLSDTVTGSVTIGCYYCHSRVPEGSAVWAKVAPFRNEHICRPCAKERRLEDADDEQWETW